MQTFYWLFSTICIFKFLYLSPILRSSSTSLSWNVRHLPYWHMLCFRYLQNLVLFSPMNIPLLSRILLSVIFLNIDNTLFCLLDKSIDHPILICWFFAIIPSSYGSLIIALHFGWISDKPNVSATSVNSLKIRLSKCLLDGVKISSAIRDRYSKKTTAK